MYVHVCTSVNHTSTCSMHELYTGSICSIHTHTQYQLSTSVHVYIAVYANYVRRYERKQTSSFFQKSFKGCVFLHVPIVHPLLTIKLQVELVLSHASEQRSPASALLTYSGHWHSPTRYGWLTVRKPVGVYILCRNELVVAITINNYYITLIITTSDHSYIHAYN